MIDEVIQRIEAAVEDRPALDALAEELRSNGDALSDPERAYALDLIERYRLHSEVEADLEVASLDRVDGPTWNFTTVSQRRGRKVEEAYLWDPTEHPRNRLGLFIEVIDSLDRGESVKVPGGAMVKRAPVTGTLSVHDPNRREPVTFTASNAEGAAKRALGGPPDEDEMTDAELVDYLAGEGEDAYTPVVPAQVLRDVFHDFEHGDLRIEMEPELDRVYAGGAVHVAGDVRRVSDGEYVGTIHRAASLARGELEVGHAEFNLDPEVQGAGFAAALQRHAFERYRDLGVKRVRVSTSEVGGYAWARAGFSFDPYYYDESIDPFPLAGYRGAGMLLNKLKDRDVPPRVDPDKWEAFLDRFPTDTEVSDARDTGDMSMLEGKFHSEWEIAQYGREDSWTYLTREMWIGKAAMLGSNWTGALRLDEVLAEAVAPEADEVVARIHHDWLARAGGRAFAREEGGDANQHFEDDEALWEEIEDALGMREGWDPTEHPRGRGGLFVEVLDWMRSTGLNAYLVGGAVRDKLQGKKPKDADFMVPGSGVAEIKAAIGDTARVDDLIVSEQHVGVRAKPHGIEDVVEIAPPRREVSTGPGHQDFEIVPDPEAPIEEDLARRDFTVNAIAENITTGEMVDPYGGAEDVKNGVLRTITPDSFRDDPLRIMRGLVRVSKDDLTPDDATREQMRQHAAALDHVSPERVQGELSKLMMGRHVADALRLARDTGVLGHMLPELQPSVGFQQESKYHDRTVDEHTFDALDVAAAANAPLEVRLALLVHDAGKPASAWRGPDGRLHYYANEALGKRAHEDVSAEIARSMLSRLRYPRDLSNDVEYLVAHHMFQEHTKPRAIKARRFLARHGPRRADLLLQHKRADHYARDEEVSGRSLATGASRLSEFGAMVRDARDAPTTIKDLKITGKDLIDLGFTPGPALGEMLNELLREVVAEPALNNREWLLKMAGKRLTKMAR